MKIIKRLAKLKDNRDTFVNVISYNDMTYMSGVSFRLEIGEYVGGGQLLRINEDAIDKSFSAPNQEFEVGDVLKNEVSFLKKTFLYTIMCIEINEFNQLSVKTIGDDGIIRDFSYWMKSSSEAQNDRSFDYKKKTYTIPERIQTCDARLCLSDERKLLQVLVDYKAKKNFFDKEINRYDAAHIEHIKRVNDAEIHCVKKHDIMIPEISQFDKKKITLEGNHYTTTVFGHKQFFKFVCRDFESERKYSKFIGKKIDISLHP